MKKLKLISILSLLLFVSIGCTDEDDDTNQVSSPTEITSTVADGTWIVTLYKEAEIVARAAKKKAEEAKAVQEVATAKVAAAKKDESDDSNLASDVKDNKKKD